MSAFVRPHYEKAPIAEALIDVRVSDPDAVTLEQLTKAADALAEEFSAPQPIQQFQVAFQAGPGPTPGGFFNSQA